MHWRVGAGHSPGNADGTLLATSVNAAGQHPAKRFPSRARAGPNAGPAASIRPWAGCLQTRPGRWAAGRSGKRQTGRG